MLRSHFKCFWLTPSASCVSMCFLHFFDFFTEHERLRHSTALSAPQKLWLARSSKPTTELASMLVSWLVASIPRYPCVDHYPPHPSMCKMSAGSSSSMGIPSWSCLWHVTWQPGLWRNWREHNKRYVDFRVLPGGLCLQEWWSTVCICFEVILIVL